MHDEHDEDEDLEEGLSEEDVARIEADYHEAQGDEERYDLALALGDIWLGSDPDLSRAWYEKALAARAGDSEAAAGRAEAFFEEWQFDDAAKGVASAGKGARASFVLGMLADRARDGAAAARHYQAANKLDPERFPVPTRFSAEQIEQAATAALAELPDDARELLEGSSVIIEDFPADELRDDYKSEGLAPTILGLFEGTPPKLLAHDAVPELPPRITLFQTNIERIAADADALRDEIARTLLHEVGHLLGMDEEDLEDAGFE